MKPPLLPKQNPECTFALELCAGNSAFIIYKSLPGTVQSDSRSYYETHHCRLLHAIFIICRNDF